MIPESHPLHQLFQELVGRHYAEEIGIRDPQVVGYVSHLLAEFCETDQLFKIHDVADAHSPTLERCCSNPTPSTAPRPRLTANARCANTSETTPYFSLECFPKASTIIAFAASE